MKIGLETHIQPNTKTKLFCGCLIKEDEPNTFTCPVCLGLPGSKPNVNSKAIINAIEVAKALKCKIENMFFFSRKSYFYPDIPKNFQITQYDRPIGSGGFIETDKKRINIRRVHLEENPGKLIYPKGIKKSTSTLVDYNRSGIPLIEVVTEPDMESIDEVKSYLKWLRILMNYLDIYSENMKSDVNISIGKGKRVEIKNITGEREVVKALEHEIAMQKIKPAKKAVTKAWMPDSGITITLREKESEEDYGYISEPDIVPIETKPLIKQIKKISEMPMDKMKRIIKTYNIPEEHTLIIISDKKLSDLFEYLSKKIDPIFTANWIKKELKREINYRKIRFDEINIKKAHLLKLLRYVYENRITPAFGRKILRETMNEKTTIDKSLEKIRVISESSVKKAVLATLKKHPDAVDKYKKGKLSVLNYLVGETSKLLEHEVPHEKIRKGIETLIKK